jgi:ABC-type antimicrobial peptide transport system permease subunit
VYFVRTFDDVRDDAALERRGAMTIVALVAIVGLALVAVGIYGVVAYTVTSRTRDIARRIAVGANRERVLWLVMRDVLRLVGVGAAIGFALVVMAGSTLRAVIVDVAPTDPAILLGAIAVLTVAAVCAHHLPHGVRARSIPRAW